MADLYEVIHPQVTFEDSVGGTEVLTSVRRKWVEQGGGEYAPQVALVGSDIELGDVSISDVEGFDTVKGQATMAESFPVVIASDQSTLDSSISAITLPTAIYNGQKTVATAGSAEALASSQAIVSGVTVKALATNTGIVYVGNAAVAAANGLELAAGESVFIEVANLATVYLDVSVNAEGVSWIAT